MEDEMTDVARKEQLSQKFRVFSFQFAKRV
jgi:hypothetical protein